MTIGMLGFEWQRVEVMKMESLDKAIELGLLVQFGVVWVMIGHC